MKFRKVPSTSLLVTLLQWLVGWWWGAVIKVARFTSVLLVLPTLPPSPHNIVQFVCCIRYLFLCFKQKSKPGWALSTTRYCPVVSSTFRPNVCCVRYHAGIGISRCLFMQPRDVLSFIFDWIFYWNFNNFNKESLKACICKLPLVKVLQRKCQICPVQKCFFVFIFSYQDYLQRLKSFQTSNVLKMN